MTGRGSGSFVFAISICLFAACGGTALVDDPSGSAGTSSGAGSASRAGASGVAGGTGSAGAASTAGAGSGGAGSMHPCLQPQESGDCNAYVPSFWHDPKTGLCVPFVYGGCGGNDNRFPSRDACIAACPNLGANYDQCSSDDECAVVSAGCCGTCEPASDSQLLSVAKQFVAAFESQRCTETPACAPCPDAGETQSTAKYFRGVCSRSHQCGLSDIRAEILLTRCNSDLECVLRDGAECCPQCDGRGWVGVNQHADFCGLSDVCDDCASVPPASMRVYCLDHVCTVGEILP